MNNITQLRKKYGISQTDLANEVGIAQNTLSQYENGLRTPRIDIMEKIAAVFNVSVNYVMGVPENDKGSPEKKEDNLSEVTRLLSLTDYKNANQALALGWRLLHIGNGDSEPTEYVLGWFGDAKDAPMFEEHTGGWAPDPDII